MEVPLYTATGWGNAAIIPQEVIPVTAAYTYPTWADIGTVSYTHLDVYKRQILNH